MKPKVLLLLMVTSLFVKVQSLSVSFVETDRVENNISLKCNWTLQANEVPTEALLFKNRTLFYHCSVAKSDVSYCSVKPSSPSRFSYLYQEAENTIRVNIKNMINSDEDFYTCYVKQQNASFSKDKLHLPLKRASTTHSPTTLPVTITTAGTTHSPTTLPVTITTADPTHSPTNLPVTKTTTGTTHSPTTLPVTITTADPTHSPTNLPVTITTESTTTHTETTSQDFSSDTIYIITSVGTIGLVIAGVIVFFAIRNYRNKRGFYDVQKFHQIYQCRPN